jgi:hypothetical protein
MQLRLDDKHIDKERKTHCNELMNRINTNREEFLATQNANDKRMNELKKIQNEHGGMHVEKQG